MISDGYEWYDPEQQIHTPYLCAEGLSEFFLTKNDQDLTFVVSASPPGDRTPYYDITDITDEDDVYIQIDGDRYIHVYPEVFAMIAAMDALPCYVWIEQ